MRYVYKNKNPKICFAASSGGHYEQLMMKPLMDKYDSFIITEKTSYDVEEKGGKKHIYYMKQVNRRERDFIPKMIVNLFGSDSLFQNKVSLYW